MSTLIHINIPRGYYIGQVRPFGFRTFSTVTKKCKSPEMALSRLAPFMKNMKRGRVLFIDDSGWYEPHQVMEISV
jgi:hypothetical protein